MPPRTRNLLGVKRLAIIQVGTNLAIAEVAAMAEFWLDKPVIAINIATYGYALRQYGIKDRFPGWGSSSTSIDRTKGQYLG